MIQYPDTKKMLVLILASALTACGGGSSSSTAAPPVAINAGTLQGSVATGSALANAKVEIKDAKGTIVSTTTDAKGFYTYSTAGLTAPFIIRVTGGTLVSTALPHLGELYSTSVSGDTKANVSTLTTLLVAQMSKQLPAEAFTKFTDNKDLLTALNDKSKIDLAVSVLTQYLIKELQINISSIGNPTTTSLDPITSGDAHDALLEKLKVADPNILNKSIELVKTVGGTVTIDPAKETLGQCIASLTLPASLKVTDTTESDAAVYSWGGMKSVDWSGQQKFQEGWYGGIYKTFYGTNSAEDTFNGEKVLRTNDETYLDEDNTRWSEAGISFPKKYIFNSYTSVDRKLNKGWQEDTYDKNDVLEAGGTLKKYAPVGGQQDIFNVTASTPLTSTITRKSKGSWDNTERNETYTEDVVFLGRESVKTLMGTFDTCKSKSTVTLVQKDLAGAVSINQVDTHTVWHVPKLGFVKQVHTDLEADDAKKVTFLSLSTTYEIIAARRNGKRYGAYDVWGGLLTWGKSTLDANALSNPLCNYNQVPGADGWPTSGWHWIVKNNNDGKTATWTHWNGTANVDETLNYPGTTTLNNNQLDFVQKTDMQINSAFSDQFIFDPVKNTLTGTHTKVDTIWNTTGTSKICEGSYPSEIKAKKLF